MIDGKITVPQVLSLVKAFYQKEGNGCGGNLHIVLDDGNIEDEHILFCLRQCEAKSDTDGIILCNLLQRMSKTQRLKIYRTHWR